METYFDPFWPKNSKQEFFSKRLFYPIFNLRAVAVNYASISLLLLKIPNERFSRDVFEISFKPLCLCDLKGNIKKNPWVDFLYILKNFIIWTHSWPFLA